MHIGHLNNHCHSICVFVLTKKWVRVHGQESVSVGWGITRVFAKGWRVPIIPASVVCLSFF